MARSAWIALGVVSLGFSALMSGCVITSSDGPIGGASNGGGDTGGSAGAATGGAGGATGGTAGASGGTAGATGGAGGQVSVACDPGMATPITCDTASSDPCIACLAANCATACGACFASGDRCSAGGPTGAAAAGEFACMQDCVSNPSNYGCAANVFPNTDDAQICCGSGPCNTSGCTGPIGETTQDLLTCINDDTNNFPCRLECGL